MPHFRPPALKAIRARIRLRFWDACMRMSEAALKGLLLPLARIDGMCKSMMLPIIKVSARRAGAAHFDVELAERGGLWT